MFALGRAYMFIIKYWRILVVCIVPLVIAGLPLDLSTKESRCGYVILLMAAFWTLEPMPLPVTSLLPIVLFPLLGVLSTGEACAPYMNSSNMMFIGGLMMAVAIEDCNLHKRIALNVLLRIELTASRMMLGFMMTAMFLSMWISNTATAALMVPIVDAVLSELESKSSQSNGILLKTISVISDSTMEAKSVESIYPEAPAKTLDPPQPLSTPISTEWTKKPKPKVRSKSEVLRKAMLLSVAYSTNVGGTGTITGTGPNLVVKGIVEDMFPESNELSFDKWMLYNIPVMLLCVLIAWGYLQVIYIRKCTPKYTNEMKDSFKEIIKKKHEELGPMSFREKAITTLFVFLVSLWIFRDPEFIKGWGKYLPGKVKDATPAIGIACLMFVIPSDPCHISKSAPLMQWKNVQAKLPWGIIILLGGGFSLAEGAKRSGLSVWASQQLSFLNLSSPILVVGVLCLLTATLTEVTSNVATANVILPVVAQLALATKVHPIYYMLPVTISCSFAFMLPVATPPNAIVFDAGRMQTIDMVKPGIFMNILCVIVEVVMINSLGLAVFDFKTLPDWANVTMSALNTTGS